MCVIFKFEVFSLFYTILYHYIIYIHIIYILIYIIYYMWLVKKVTESALPLGELDIQ